MHLEAYGKHPASRGNHLDASGTHLKGGFVFITHKHYYLQHIAH